MTTDTDTTSHPQVWTVEVEAVDTERHIATVYLTKHAARAGIADLVTTRFIADWDEARVPVPDRADYHAARDWIAAVLDAWDSLDTDTLIVLTGHDPAGIPTPPAAFTYSWWRHGGWYVDNITYPGGGCGCVSRNFADRRWRIVCDPRPFDQQPTFTCRDDAALAEWRLVHGLDRPGITH